jgi:hypothetical protein
MYVYIKVMECYKNVYLNVYIKLLSNINYSMI